MLFKINFCVRFFLLAVLFLTACVNSSLNNKSFAVNSTSSIATGVVQEKTNATMNNYIAKHKAIIQQLQVSDIDILQVGDKVRFIIPSDKLFEQRTSIISNEGYRILNNVVKLLKDQRKFSIRIAAHTDSKITSEIGLAITRQQAEVVGKYLWNRDIDSTFLSALGYGSSVPIANNRLEQARALNRRVEIDLMLIMYDTID